MSNSPSLSIFSSGAVHNVTQNHSVNNPPAPAFTQEDNAKLSALFPNAPLRRIPRYARMGLLACAQALTNIPAEQRTSLGLVVGTAYAGMGMSMDFMDSILDAEPRLSSPTAFSHAVNNMGAGLLSLYLGLQGPCHTATQFALSFAAAIQAAATLIYANRAEYVLVGCMDETDARFHKFSPKNTLFEGAIFFLVGKEDANHPKISIDWDEFSPENLINNQPHTTALQSAAATLQAIEAKKDHAILCQENGNCATIRIWR